PKYRLSLRWLQHSCDVYNGIPMNIAYYAGLLIWLSEVTGMMPHMLYGTLSNVHLYDNSIPSACILIEKVDQDLNVHVTYKKSGHEDYPTWSNFKWDESKVTMGEKLPVEMLTYSK